MNPVPHLETPVVPRLPVRFAPDQSRFIMQLVAAEYGVRVAELLGNARGPVRLSWPRQVAMFLCREYTTATSGDLARRFNRRDHGTILHAANQVAGRLPHPECAADRARVARIVERLAVQTPSQPMFSAIRRRLDDLREEMTWLQQFCHQHETT